MTYFDWVAVAAVLIALVVTGGVLLMTRGQDDKRGQHD